MSNNTIIFSNLEMFFNAASPLHPADRDAHCWNKYLYVFYLLKDNFESRECVIGVSSASCWSWCTFLENLEERRTNAIPDICILTLRCEFFSRGSDFFRKVPTNHQHLWRWCQISGLTGAQCFVSLLSVQVLPTKQEVSDNS